MMDDREIVKKLADTCPLVPTLEHGYVSGPRLRFICIFCDVGFLDETLPGSGEYLVFPVEWRSPDGHEAHCVWREAVESTLCA